MKGYWAVALSLTKVGDRTMQRASVARLRMIAFLEEIKTWLSASSSRRITSRYRTEPSGGVSRSFAQDSGLTMLL
jgi:hypothetical protein